ncbi:D-glycero-alpha-D-manno-heptose-1,7-bisphosphate 7-phosphatase [Abyssisolibacter fermentans]|uniref:D-glycero-alpha-D-manno-heptose-1,7-bisphosphate 7-phosphatase n=1 Tax=Abyssisolibacter fermentans TaxID=1766203 RepID=UPI000830CC9C|nr:HAD-IIIA family hydrolase [Abyssisolibacter fermentans]
MTRALFLDRDGVINDNKRPVNKPQDLIIYDNVKNGLQRANENGYDIFVVTNQGGIELGFMTHSDLKEVHAEMVRQLKPYCTIKDIMYCPDYHRKSKYRKPEPGMLLELRDKYSIDMNQSWMIGDMETDITAGKRAGCKTAKIGKRSKQADINGSNLEEVVNKILEM